MDSGKIIFTLIAFCLSIGQSQTFPLWEEGAPGAMGSEPEDIPTLKISHPPDDGSNGSGVLLIPGGGYKALSATGTFEKWLTDAGFKVFSLSYRLPIHEGYQWPVPFWDASRAMRTIRLKAEEYGLDSNRIGVAGFSSGGHLSTTLGTHFDMGNPDTSDAIEQMKSRPDFMILMSPVVTFVGPYTHTPSRNRMLGTDPAPTQEMMEFLSNQLQVTSETPPSFMAHGDLDGLVPPENSVMFDSALRANDIHSKYVVAQGFEHNVPQDGDWTLEALAWLDSLGFMETIVPTGVMQNEVKGKDYHMAVTSDNKSKIIQMFFSGQGPYIADIFNINGKVIKSFTLNNSHEVTFLNKDLQNGIYVIRLRSKQGEWVKRLVLM